MKPDPKILAMQGMALPISGDGIYGIKLLSEVAQLPEKQRKYIQEKSDSLYQRLLEVVNEESDSRKSKGDSLPLEQVATAVVDLLAKVGCQYRRRKGKAGHDLDGVMAHMSVISPDDSVN